MASTRELSDFLEAVERRAFKQTACAVRDDHAALDIVQDSMMKLAEKYGDKPVAELPMLFQRILQNTKRDFWRRQKVRNLWTSLLSSFGSSEEGEERDPLDTIDAEDGSDEPSALLERSQTIKLIESALENLPIRQREAFVLRYWEGMDVVETAKIMGCSGGSVKTHCSRAAQALACMLKKQGLENLGLSSLGLNNQSSKTGR
ncbi:MAG: RNA polymerase sigma factor [Methylotenera sp.]|nr:RNA polymerase sigma factor [Methylotenera sp.]MSP99560.1 RNA polymerase sigma factor [Methylotenera sp.]